MKITKTEVVTNLITMELTDKEYKVLRKMFGNLSWLIGERDLKLNRSELLTTDVIYHELRKLDDEL